MKQEANKKIFETFIEPGYEVLRPYVYEVSNRVGVFLKKRELLEDRYQVRDKMLDVFRTSTPETAREWYLAFAALDLEDNKDQRKWIRLCERLANACLSYQRNPGKYRTPFSSWEIAILQTRQETPNEYSRWIITLWKVGTWLSVAGVDIIYLFVLLATIALILVFLKIV